MQAVKGPLVKERLVHRQGPRCQVLPVSHSPKAGGIAKAGRGRPGGRCVSGQPAQRCGERLSDEQRRKPLCPPPAPEQEEPEEEQVWEKCTFLCTGISEFPESINDGE